MEHWRLYNYDKKAGVYGTGIRSIKGYGTGWILDDLIFKVKDGWTGFRTGVSLEKEPLPDCDLDSEIDFALYEGRAVRTRHEGLYDDLMCGSFPVTDWRRQDYAKYLLIVADHFYKLGRIHERDQKLGEK